MEIGKLVAGKYRLNRLLGTGGMASVWAATNVFTDREVAVKVMSTPATKNTEATRRFLLEAKVSARINHPNIIEIHDVGQTEDASLFMVMELLSGHSLEEVISRQMPRMLARDFLQIMATVANALAAAHARGVVHRDLKPTNIYVHTGPDGRELPKILDFGVSKILEEDQNFAVTVAGTVLGSPLYMSPEQARGETSIDGRTDIFSFGAILFEAFAARRPYDAPNFNALIVTIATNPPRSIDQDAAQLPESIRSIVRDCLIVDRDRRIRSFDEIGKRIDVIVHELQSSTLRLPAPYGIAGDPEATNVLPALGLSTDRTHAPSRTAFSAPWNTVSVAPKPPPPRSPKWMTFGIVAAAMALAFTIATAAWLRGREINAPIAGVRKSSQSGAQTSATGRLEVTASEGSCQVSIDGEIRGITPTTLEMSVGSHRVECSFPGNRKTMTTVYVHEHGTTSFRF